MKKFKLAFLLLVVLSLSVTSCYTTRTSLGNYRESTGTPTNFSKGKQLWLFWGLLPAGRTQVSVPKIPDCQVVTRFNFVDGLIFVITGGIIETETIKILVKK